MQKLTRFLYEAENASGQRISGSMLGMDAHDVIRKVQKQGVIVLSVEEESPVSSVTLFKKKLKSEDVYQVLHELATLLDKGVMLAEAIKAIIEGGHHPILVTQLKKILAQLQSGQTLSFALESSTLELPQFFIQLVKAGEISGELAKALRRGVAQIAHQQKVRKEMKNALIYPTILVLTGISVLLIIFTVVVPKFESIAARAQGELPLLSRVILGMGGWFNQHFMWVIMAIAVISILMAKMFRGVEGKERLRRIGFKVPVISDWLREIDAHLWASTMAALLSSKVPLLTAMDYAREAVFGAQMRVRLLMVKDAVKQGAFLSAALKSQNVLSASACSLISVGERAGEVESMLQSLAESLEEKAKQRMVNVLALIEPAAIIIIGVFVGIIILGVVQTIMGVTNVKI